MPFLPRKRPKPLSARIATFCFAMLVAYVSIAPLVFLASGSAGAAASGVAMSGTLLAGIVSMVSSHRFASPQDLFLGYVVGMFARMGVPIVLMLAVYVRGGPLVDAGMVFYLLGFYFVMLILQTAMTSSLPVSTGQSIVKGT